MFDTSIVTKPSHANEIHLVHVLSAFTEGRIQKEPEIGRDLRAHMYIPSLKCSYLSFPFQGEAVEQSRRAARLKDERKRARSIQYLYGGKKIESR